MKRLGDAAAKFWPALPKEERLERVHATLVEILEREQRSETHKISWWAKWMFVRTYHRAKKFSAEITAADLRAAEDEDGDDKALRLVAGSVPPDQFTVALAHECWRLLPLLPVRHRRVMAKLASGANPLEISDEVKLPIMTVLAIIRDARLWLEDGGQYLYQSRFDPDRTQRSWRVEHLKPEKRHQFIIPDQTVTEYREAVPLEVEQPALFAPIRRRGKPSANQILGRYAA